MTPGEDGSVRRPNLVLVIADQWRAGCLGFLGEDPVRPPALDELAERPRVLTRAVSNYPVCSPCRAMLMTGRYPYGNGVHLNVNSATAEPGVGMRPETRCWSDVLADEGYALGYIGKWHLEAPVPADAAAGEGVREDGRVWDAYTAPDRRHGFGFWYSHDRRDDHARPHYWTGDTPREAPAGVDLWSAEHGTDVALSFLDGAARDYHRGGTPIALVLSYNPPRQPFDQVPQRYLDGYSTRSARELLTRPNVDWDRPEAAEAARAAPSYYAAITGVDHRIGRVLAALDEHPLTGDTFVVFTSDHGMQLGSHGLMYKNVPYEESTRDHGDGDAAHAWNQKTVLRSTLGPRPHRGRDPLRTSGPALDARALTGHRTSQIHGLQLGPLARTTPRSARRSGRDPEPGSGGEPRRPPRTAARDAAPMAPGHRGHGLPQTPLLPDGVASQTRDRVFAIPY
ncbi:sulfatase-like hydrolase/transferase [Streptomyces sp. NPDC008139]|uniref:sulfatase-like hydrolase/transferase n=1 Tax=Streptomyces sp. NPDC008139 TaxID=3364814 RepID=UPI0036F12B76